jgi:DNA primase
VARYADDSREKVRDAVDFIDLVGTRTELRRASAKSYVGLCPFHDERTPSFSIEPFEKLYYCFGCGASGDVFRFVMETESLGFVEALELLADRYRVPLERTEEDPQAAQKRARRERLNGLLERTTAYYVRLLWEADEAAAAREYLESRGLLEATAREFRVGYSPADWDRVTAASLKAGFTEDELLAAGVSQRTQGRSGIIDRFRGRLMFPWTDTRGRILGFGARALAADDQPKYLNSSDGEVFHKGQQVYGTYLARVPAAKVGSVVLVEGYTDVLAMHQAGLRHVVGQQGTALTEGQAEEIAKLAPTVLMCLDGDEAGQKATARGASVLRRLPRNPPEVRVVPLPAGTDPADVAAGEEGAREMGALLDAAAPFARWQIERALARGDLDSSEGRDQVLTYASQVLRGLPQSVLREELVQLVAGRLGLSEALAASALAPGRAGSRGRGPGNGSGRFGGAGAPGNGADQFGVGARLGGRVSDRREAAEHEFLALCIAFPGPGQRRLTELDPETTFASPLARRAAVHLTTHLEAPASDLPPDDERLSGLMAQLVLRARSLDPDVDEAELRRAALHLDLARLDRDIATARISQGPVSDLAAQRQEVLGELRRLTR